MPIMPFQILGIWLRGLLSLAFLGLGIYLVHHFYEAKRPVTRHVVQLPEARAMEPADPDRTDGDAARPRREVVEHRAGWTLGADRETAFLILGLMLIGGSLGGGLLGWRVFLALKGNSTGEAAQRDVPSDLAERKGTVHRVRRPDGCELHAVALGPEDAPTLVMTHGWGADSAEWKYSLEKLAERHRVIVWDLPGVGRSTRHPDNDFSLERMAGDLDAIIDLAGMKPVVVVGHSIGGMIALTYCQIKPEAIGSRVAGLALVHTTFTNPVETTKHAALYRALQKPLLEPLCHAMIVLAPVFWVLDWLSYLNGSAHRSTHRDSFSGKEPWNKLDFVARYITKYWPAVLARGMLAMFRLDAKGTLGTINVPTLVVAGERDNTTEPWASGVMAESIPSASLVNLDEMKHQGHLERDAVFADALVRFVDGLSAPSRSAETTMKVETL